ncbi:MAG: FCD domain-containing protein [Ilumatobacteraceae bacterium]
MARTSPHSTRNAPSSCWSCAPSSRPSPRSSAARRRTPEQLDEIRAVLDSGREATAANDVVKAASAHRQFHLAIERAAANSYLGPAVEPLRAQTELVFSLLVDRRGIVGWSEHVDILAAIEAGDPDAAQRATRRHMSSVLDDLRDSGAAAASST